MITRNAIVVSVSVVLLLVLVALVLVSNKGVEPEEESFESSPEVSYAYTVEEGNNFTLVKIKGMLGPQVESTSDSVVYEFSINNVAEPSNLITIDLGSRSDFIGGYEVVTGENETQVLTATDLLVEDVVKMLSVGQGVEVHAMVNATSDVENLCVAESCQLLIESSQKNIEWDADRFIQSVMDNDSNPAKPKGTLRIIFIAETI